MQLAFIHFRIKPAIQSLEREVLRQVGWGLLDLGRRGLEIEAGIARLEVTQVDGQVDIWEATIREGRRLAIPACGHPIEVVTKSESDLLVSDT